MLPGDPISRVLYIDQTRRRSWVKDRADLFDLAAAMEQRFAENGWPPAWRTRSTRWT